MNFLIPFKVLKKHSVVHLLWFFFVPALSSIGIFFNLKTSFENEGLEFVSSCFSPSEMGEQKLANYIIQAFEVNEL